MTRPKPTPVEVCHNFEKKTITHAEGYKTAVHTCIYCGVWTANVLILRNEVCPAKDRRKTKRDRRAA